MAGPGQYRYRDRSQIQALFFEGPRSCQYRLRWLHDKGLVNAWRVTVRPNYGCRPSIYLLSRRGAAALADWLGSDAGPFLRRAEHAIERHFHLVHQLEANQFFVDLALATRDRDELSLTTGSANTESRALMAKAKSAARFPTAGADC